MLQYMKYIQGHPEITNLWAWDPLAHTQTDASMHSHTSTDLWAMRFILPTLYSTLIHQKPLSPHTVWDGDCIVTQRQRHRTRANREREEWGGGRGRAGVHRGGPRRKESRRSLRLTWTQPLSAPSTTLVGTSLFLWAVYHITSLVPPLHN